MESLPRDSKLLYNFILHSSFHNFFIFMHGFYMVFQKFKLSLRNFPFSKSKKNYYYMKYCAFKEEILQMYHDSFLNSRNIRKNFNGSKFIDYRKKNY